MWLLEQVAERRIREAVERGELEGLPGAGRRLELEDDRLVPETLRMAYRVLKNAGVVPEEVRARNEVAHLGVLLAAATGGDERARIGRRLAVLRLRLAARRGGETLVGEAGYAQRMARRLEGGP